MTPALRSAIVAALRSVADALEAEEAEPSPPVDPLLDLKAIMDQYGIGRTAVGAAIRRGDLPASVGPRRRILVKESDVRAWLTSRPARADLPPGTDPDDALEVALARGGLVEDRSLRRT